MKPFVVALAVVCIVALLATMAFADWTVQPRGVNGRWIAVPDVCAPATTLPCPAYGPQGCPTLAPPEPTALVRVRPVVGTAVVRAIVAAPANILAAAPVRSAAVALFGHQRRQQRRDARLAIVQ